MNAFKKTLNCCSILGTNYAGWTRAVVGHRSATLPRSLVGGSLVGWSLVGESLVAISGIYRPPRSRLQPRRCSLMRGSAKAARLRQHVSVELRGLPAVRRANLVGSQAEGASQVRAGYSCSGDVRAPKNGAIKKCSSQIRVAQVRVHQDGSLKLRAR